MACQDSFFFFFFKWQPPLVTNCFCVFLLKQQQKIKTYQNSHPCPICSRNDSQGQKKKITFLCPLFFLSPHILKNQQSVEKKNHVSIFFIIII